MRSFDSDGMIPSKNNLSKMSFSVCQKLSSRETLWLKKKQIKHT